MPQKKIKITIASDESKVAGTNKAIAKKTAGRPKKSVKAEKVIKVKKEKPETPKIKKTKKKGNPSASSGPTEVKTANPAVVEKSEKTEGGNPAVSPIRDASGQAERSAKIDKFDVALASVPDFKKLISKEDKDLVTTVIAENAAKIEAISAKANEANLVKESIAKAEISQEKTEITPAKVEPKIETKSEHKINIIDEDDPQPVAASPQASAKATILSQPAPTAEDREEYPIKRSVALYKKIALFFVVAALGLAGAIFYFSFTSVTINLIPDQERINGTMVIDVYDKTKTADAGQDKLIGAVTKIPMDTTKNYVATGETIIGEDVSGMVTIYNNYDKNQPLVATTRLMSAGGKLFRLRDTVNVPAGGKVDAEIYADKPTPDLEVDPTRFTIPGLWAGIQDKVYAESKAVIKYANKTKKKIAKEDLDNSLKDIKQELLKKAKDEITKQYAEYNQTIFSIDESSMVIDNTAKVDEEKDNFDVKIKADVILIAFDNNQAAELAKKKFLSSLSSNQELIEFNNSNIIYNLSSFNFADKTASINAAFDGKVSLRSGSEIVDRTKLTGLSEKQLNDFLNDVQGISGYEIKFFPTFIKKAPNLPERIYINVKK